MVGFDLGASNARRALELQTQQEIEQQYGNEANWIAAGRPRTSDSLFSRLDPWEHLKSAGRSIDQEIFQPVFDDVDDFYKENIRPYASEIGTAVGAYFGVPQLGAMLGGALEGNSGSGGSGFGGFGGGGFSDVANRQAQGYQQAMDIAEANKNYGRGQFKPYINAGKSAIDPMLAELGIGGTPYKDPLTDQVINQQLRDIQQSRKASGMWSAGSTPGALADATLQTQLGMRQNRFNNLSNVANMGLGAVGNLMTNEALMTDSIMDAATNQAMALAAGDAVRASQTQQALQQAGQVGGDLFGGIISGISGLFGGGGGSSSSGGGGSWNFADWGSGGSGYDLFDWGF